MKIKKMDEIIVVSIDKLKKIIQDCLSEIGKNQTSKELDKDVFLSSKETCRALQICPATLHAWIKKGKLKPRRFGRKLLFNKNEILMSDTKMNR